MIDHVTHVCLPMLGIASALAILLGACSSMRPAVILIISYGAGARRGARRCRATLPSRRDCRPLGPCLSFQIPTTVRAPKRGAVSMPSSLT